MMERAAKMGLKPVEIASCSNWGVAKVDSISNLLLREGGVVADRGGRRNNVCSYFFVNDRVMYSPTTSPYGYSSFPKEVRYY